MLGENHKSVLIVDDDPHILRLLRKALSKAGYDVAEACDGRSAMNRVRQSEVDVMVTDLVMPGQEGVETITQLRREFPQVKIVAMSGAANGRYLRICELLGANAVLQKPFPPKTLVEAIENLLPRRPATTNS
jgi:CheY-like chemotaxis protein